MNALDRMYLGAVFNEYNLSLIAERFNLEDLVSPAGQPSIKRFFRTSQLKVEGLEKSDSYEQTVFTDSLLVYPKGKLRLGIVSFQNGLNVISDFSSKTVSILNLGKADITNLTHEEAQAFPSKTFRNSRLVLPENLEEDQSMRVIMTISRKSGSLKLEQEINHSGEVYFHAQEIDNKANVYKRLSCIYTRGQMQGGEYNEDYNGEEEMLITTEARTLANIVEIQDQDGTYHRYPLIIPFEAINPFQLNFSSYLKIVETNNGEQN